MAPFDAIRGHGQIENDCRVQFRFPVGGGECVLQLEMHSIANRLPLLSFAVRSVIILIKQTLLDSNPLRSYHI